MNNPQIKQAMPIAKQIMNSGASKQEQLKMACQKVGLDENQVAEQLRNNGINF